MSLSEKVEKAAFRLQNGELAWKRDDLAAAVEELVESGQAILGGEIWFVHNGTVTGVLPTGSGEMTVMRWECPDRSVGQAWADFVRECAEETTEAVAELQAEEVLKHYPGGQTYYNLTWSDETEYERLSARRAV